MNTNQSDIKSTLVPASEAGQNSWDRLPLWPLELRSQAVLWDLDTQITGPWVARVPLVFWLIDALRPRRIGIVGDFARPAFLAACEAVGRLGIDVQVLGAFVTPPLDRVEGPLQNQGWHRIGVQQRLNAEAAQSLLASDPVDMLVLDASAASLGRGHSAELWRAVVMGPRIIIVEGQTADAPPWCAMFDRAAHMRVGDKGGAHLAILDEAEGHAATALQSLLRDPERASRLRRLLERLGAGLVAGQAAREARATAEKLAITLTELGERVEVAAAELEAVKKRNARLESDLHSAETRAAIAQQQAACLEAKLESVDANLVAARQETGRLDSDLRAALRDRDQIQSKLERVEQERTASLQADAEKVTPVEGLEGGEDGATPVEAKRAAGRASVTGRLTRLLRARLSNRALRQSAARVRNTGLFDEEYYHKCNPDVAASDMRGALHFALHGWKEGRKPSPHFDPEFYLDQNPDVRAAGINPLLHYFQHGRSEGRQPLPSDTKSEISSDADLKTMIRQTGFFDDEYYRKNNPDVAMSGINGALHFALHGWREGRKPSPRFDPKFYLDQNPDVRAAGMNPLLHYVQHGRSEGRPPLPGLYAKDAPPLRRVELLEQRAASIEAMMVSDRCRLEWVLGSVDGVTAETDHYIEYRKSKEYQAAYGSTAPLVSVCVATMDRADLLVERSIASLLAQTYRNLQIVVVGDACSDDTALRLAAIRDDRIQFVNLPERGPYPRPGIDRWYVAGSNAMNKALSLCEGQFVTHLDDDDAMVPHRIEKLISEALQYRSDFLWHSFWYEKRDGSWVRLGNGRLEQGQVSTGSIFYHRYFAQFPWDVKAYRLSEPGDWNRLRKIKLLRPHARFVDEPLLYHYAEGSQGAFVPRDGERFLE